MTATKIGKAEIDSHQLEGRPREVMLMWGKCWEEIWASAVSIIYPEWSQMNWMCTFCQLLLLSLATCSIKAEIVVTEISFHPYIANSLQFKCKQKHPFSPQDLGIYTVSKGTFMLAAVLIPNPLPLQSLGFKHTSTPLQISIHLLIHSPAVCLRLQRAAAHNPCASCQIILQWQINNATVNFI